MLRIFPAQGYRVIIPTGKTHFQSFPNLSHVREDWEYITAGLIYPKPLTVKEPFWLPEWMRDTLEIP